jgi:hypothetical protein
MPNVVTITRLDVIALIEKAAKKLARGNKTEAVALAMRRLLDEDARAGSLLRRAHLALCRHDWPVNTGFPPTAEKRIPSPEPVRAREAAGDEAAGGAAGAEPGGEVGFGADAVLALPPGQPVG